MASDISAGLAARGHVVISGAAHGIDGCAHRSVLAARRRWCYNSSGRQRDRLCHGGL